MKTALVLTVAIVGIAAAVLFANRSWDATAFQVDWRLVQLPPKEVELGKPERRSIVRRVSAPGTVESRNEAEVASRVVGRVVELLVAEGDQVKQGDVLVRLDDEDLQQLVASSEARIQRIGSAIEQATEEQTKSQRDLALKESLFESGAVTETEVLDERTRLATLTAALAMSRADLADAQANLRRTQTELERAVILAPMDGTVADLEVEVGEVVIAGTTNLPGTVLMTINDLNQLQVRTRVDQSDVRWVAPDQPARIFLRSGDRAKPVEGRVAHIAPKGTKETEVVSFETLIDVVGKDDSVRPGMTASVEIEVDRTDQALSLPIQAVVHRKLKDLPDTELFREWADKQPRTPGEAQGDRRSRYLKVVFVLEGSIARAIPVETGLSDENFVQIVNGLDEAATVIVGPFRVLDELKDGDTVQLVTAEKASEKVAEKTEETPSAPQQDPDNPVTESSK